MSRFGFVGVGRMGGAMVRSTIAAGCPVVVCDADPSLAQSIAGATVLDNPGAVAQAATVIGIAVMDAEQVREVCLGPRGLFGHARPGTVVLVHSTIDHGTLREVVAAGAAAGVAVLDAPVSGAMGHMSVPDLCVMVGGETDAFRQAEPMLATFASLVVHLGPTGSGLDAKLALNVLRYLGFLIGQEGARLADASGIDPEQMAAIVSHTHAFEFRGDFSNGQHSEDLRRRIMNVTTAQKDIGAARSRADELGVELAVSERTLDLLRTIWAVPAAEL